MGFSIKQIFFQMGNSHPELLNYIVTLWVSVTDLFFHIFFTVIWQSCSLIEAVCLESNVFFIAIHIVFYSWSFSSILSHFAKRALVSRTFSKVNIMHCREKLTVWLSPNCLISPKLVIRTRRVRSLLFTASRDIQVQKKYFVKQTIM